MDDVFPPLNAPEIRVLGALVEKQIATPDYYPLTLHALVNACNQLTNREPVVTFDEATVVRALDGLREKRFATLFSGQESRVAKHKHTLTDRLLLTPAEVALLCVLFLRGPQTVGELRTRSERLFAFDTLAEVEDSLAALAARQPQPLVAKLPRAPGTKESRYIHLFSGPAEAAPPQPASAPENPIAAEPTVVASVSADAARLASLEQETAALRSDLAALRQEFATFRKQFD